MTAPARPAAPVTALECHSYRVPTDQPEADGTLAWSSTTAVVVEVRAAGVVGTGWTYSADACRTLVEEMLRDAVVGGDALEITGIHEQMVRHCRNLGRPGVVSCAISAVDIALWDLKARLLGLSLASLFGRCREAVPVYGSGGFTTYDDETLGRQLTGWMDEGMTRVKLKIGESWGTNPGRDLERVAFARKVVGDGELYVDANGGYSRKQAVRIGRRLVEEHGVSWFEEPVSSDDLEGLREVRDQLACDVAAGEYGYDEPYFVRMVTAGAVDCLQVDVTRCGGYTSFLRAAAIAVAHGLEISAHCAPALHGPIGVALPNLRHIEYFHDHARLEALLFEGTLPVTDGALVPDTSVDGHGMTLRPGDAFRLA